MYIKNKPSLLSLSRNETELRVISVLTNLIEEIFEIAQPSHFMSENISFKNNKMIIKGEEINLLEFSNFHLLALGKASQAMAKWLIDNFPMYFSRIILVSPNESDLALESFPNLVFFKSGHPIPDSESVKAAEHSLEFISNLSPDELCFILISGGGSALFESPDLEISLKDYQSLINLLLTSGATIQEMNTIRKHFSKVKGGKLVSKTNAKIITIIMSDVIGNDPSVIASGPTVPDKTTWNDCKNTLSKYDLLKELPESIMKILERGLKNEVLDTPSDQSLFPNVSNFIVGSNLFLLEHLESIISNDYNVSILTHTLIGESREKGKELAKTSIQHFTDEKKPYLSPYCFLIFSGETTVTIKAPKGLGGRNQELALSFALEIGDKYPIYLAAFGTDGIDGISQAAGALVGPFTISDEIKKQNAINSLHSHDSNSFFKKNGGEIITGHTGTNLMDIGIICLKFNEEK